MGRTNPGGTGETWAGARTGSTAIAASVVITSSAISRLDFFEPFLPISPSLPMRQIRR